MTLLCFLFYLPSTPPESSGAFNWSLAAFAWLSLLLHLPVHPTPIFLLPFDQVLPLSILASRSLGRVFVPAFAFFFPACVLLLAMLSASLDGSLLQLSKLNSWSPPSPVETRYLMGGLIIFVLLLSFALGFSILVHTLLTPQDGPAPLTWDKYSTPVGLEARRAFVRVVTAYSGPHYFPAPLNQLHILLIQFPSAISAILGRGSVPRKLAVLEVGLWRATVAPFTFLVSGLWLWNLRNW